MIEKDYYRLDELQNRFGITEPDIQYLLERRLVNACFHIENTKFVVESWKKSKFIGYVHLIYRGIVTIPENELAKLLHQKKITPLNYLLSTNGHFELVCTDYGYEPYEDFFTEWRPKYQDEKNQPWLNAKLSPFVTKISDYSYSKARKEAIKLEGLESESGYIHLEDFKIPELKLPAAFNTFKFSEMCIQKEELDALGILKKPAFNGKELLHVPNSAITESDLLNEEATQMIFKNQFEELLARILKKHPLLQAKEVHKLLCIESKKEEDSRPFDVENILYPETRGIISWRDIYRNNAERSYNLDSLRNEISKIRKKIRNETADAFA